MNTNRYITSIPEKGYVPKVYKNHRILTRYLEDKILLNDSSRTLTGCEIECLTLGLKYIPTIRIRHQNEVEDSRVTFEKYENRMNTIVHFNEIENNRRTERKPNKRGHLAGIVPSIWSPDIAKWNTNPKCKRTKNELINYVPNVGNNNLNFTDPEILTAIKTLKGYKDIHILPADKGGAIVLWDTTNYDKEGLRQLTDAKNYREVDQAMFQLRTEGLRKTAARHAEWLRGWPEPYINESEYEAIKEVKASGSPIYFLPKIHKEKRTDTGTYAGRPIVATHSATVHLFDKYLTNLTAPLLTLIPGSLVDTMDLINKLPKTELPPNSKIVTSDITGLYPSIPQIKGIEATVQFYKEMYPTLIKICNDENKIKPPPAAMFKILLEFVLTNSYISFKNQRFFHQITGTAMGMCISVFFANCFVYQLTRNQIERPPQWLVLFQRYIDDLILVIRPECDTEPLNAFFDSITTNAIKYETTEPSVSTPMLDLIIEIDQTTNLILTKPYRKETAADTFIHYTSNHPICTLNSIPYAQFLRLRRNASNLNDFLIHAKKLTRSFVKRGYPKRTLRDALEKATIANRTQLLIRTKIKDAKPTGNKNLKRNAKYIKKYHKLIDQQTNRKTLNRLNDEIIIIEGEEANMGTNSSIINSNRRTIHSFFTKVYKNPDDE